MEIKPIVFKKVRNHASSWRFFKTVSVGEKSLVATKGKMRCSSVTETVLRRECSRLMELGSLRIQSFLLTPCSLRNGCIRRLESKLGANHLKKGTRT